MKITVVGTGYVGLVTGVSLAEIGHHVTCFDISDEKIVQLNKGISPIYEPGLDEMLQRNQEINRLFFTSNPVRAYENPEIVIIAVGTPENENGSANLSYIQMVSKDIATYIKQDEIIIVTKSTVPVGTNKKVKNWIQESLQHQISFSVASNPEFLREGSAIYDTFNGDRIIIGSEDKHVASILEDMYSPLCLPIIHTDIESAEMIKYASNAFLATKISFINEIANICEKVGANIEEVAKGIGRDRRIGSQFLQAGIGYGGSCFPKDTKALVQIAGDVEHKFELLESVIKVNNQQQIKLYNKAKENGGSFQDKKIAVLGASFKPNTDDVREASSLFMIDKLLQDRAEVHVYDPIALSKVSNIFGDKITYCASFKDAIKDASIAFILTEWEEIKSIPLSLYVELMMNPVIYDGRNCYPLNEAQQYPLTYISIGRKPIYNTIKISGEF
ncbi:UDP-glucose/GDP-mannose dehydrogenase family protein [Bacillus sp. J37]|uniref:UDP-glucose dehydrogenase family protein n=1 Tax=Bacillus sp. J37 TaxID=935837 RepID=UPI00047C73F7|nr:UDP-glucose/GDP-mannose dehydrogenase family protein [Bacillus sp. J37]